MDFTVTTIGEGKPSIAIVGCVHGNELVGKKVIGKLKKIKLKKGSLSLIIANTKAVKAKKRGLKKDLNRIFPGKKNGDYEERLAYDLALFLKDFDYVVDVHGTSSNIDSLIITTKLNKETKKLLKATPVKKTVLVSKSFFNNGTLMSVPKAGIVLEYGPDKLAKDYSKALRDVRGILRNLGFIAGAKKNSGQKDFYYIEKSYVVPTGFKPVASLQDFKKINKGDVIGYFKKREVKSKLSFYPVFVGKGSYDKTIALIGQKIKRKI